MQIKCDKLIFPRNYYRKIVNITNRKISKTDIVASVTLLGFEIKNNPWKFITYAVEKRIFMDEAFDMLHHALKLS